MTSTADLLDRLRVDQERSHDRVRAMLAHKPEVLAEYDASIEYLNSGRAGLESLWHSLSVAQRRVVEIVGPDRRLVRLATSPHRYSARGGDGAILDCAHAKTVMALSRHRLLASAGTTDDPWQIAVSTPRLHDLLAFRASRY